MQLLLLLLLLRELLLHLLHLLHELSCLLTVHGAAVRNGCAVWQGTATTASDDARGGDDTGSAGAEEGRRGAVTMRRRSTRSAAVSALPGGAQENWRKCQFEMRSPATSEGAAPQWQETDHWSKR